MSEVRKIAHVVFISSNPNCDEKLYQLRGMKGMKEMKIPPLSDDVIAKFLAQYFDGF